MKGTSLGARADARQRRDRVAQPEGAVGSLASSSIEADEVGVGRHDVQVRHRGLAATASSDRGLAGQHVEDGREARFVGDADAGRGVALRIEIEDQHLLADRRQRGAEVDGGGGLADAALLVGDGDARGPAWHRPRLIRSRPRDYPPSWQLPTLRLNADNTTPALFRQARISARVQMPILSCFSTSAATSRPFKNKPTVEDAKYGADKLEQAGSRAQERAP